LRRLNHKQCHCRNDDQQANAGRQHPGRHAAFLFLFARYRSTRHNDPFYQDSARIAPHGLGALSRKPANCQTPCVR
jgi:hypothetical protein